MPKRGQYDAWAWEWLGNLERVDPPKGKNYFRVVENQIRVRAAPAVTTQTGRSMLIHVSVAHPRLPPGKRVKGFGTSLWEAVNDLQRELWRQGVKLPLVKWREDM